MTARSILQLVVLGFLLGWSEGRAGQVRWTASGMVSKVEGAELSPLASVSDSVEIELSYQDSAELIKVGGWTGVFTHVEFRDDVNISLKVTIGMNTWEGTLASGNPGGVRTIELVDFQIGGSLAQPTEDEFIVRVAASDGGGFPEFPGIPAGPQHLMEVSFRDSSGTAAAPDYIGSEDLTCAAPSVSRVTEADGMVMVGPQQIAFTIDPSTIRAGLINVEPIRLTGITFENNEVTLAWPTRPGRFYVIQYLDEFLCWRELTSVLALEESTTETFFPAPTDNPQSQFYRVIEEEE